MASRYVGYYEAVAEQMLPFLLGRKVAVEQRYPKSAGPMYRRHEGTGEGRDWIAIRDGEDVARWAGQYAAAFHAHLKPEGPGCWFALDIDSRDLPIEMAWLAALHALAMQDLTALVKFSGSDGFHLMWDIPSLQGLGGSSIWDVERAVVVAVAAEVEDRLACDPLAKPIREAVGEGGRLIVTSSQDAEHKEALLFDAHILKPNVNVRVPVSLHAASGLAAVPLDRDQFAGFNEAMATPELVVDSAEAVEMPRNELAAVQRALKAWGSGSR